MTTGWNTYGHDTGHTNVNDEIGGPVDLDQKWELRVNVQSQPVVRNGRIFASCSNRQVRAFSMDGDRLWTYHHPRPEEFSRMDIDHHACRKTSTSPAVEGNAVYHVLYDRCVSLDVSDGTERWSTLLPTEEGSLLGGALQLGPEGRLYVAYTDGIHVLESHSGSVLWSKSTRHCGNRPSLTRVDAIFSTRTTIT